MSRNKNKEPKAFSMVEDIYRSRSVNKRLFTDPGSVNMRLFTDTS